jgi:predicted CXXCH cytochrome family protein
MIRKLAFLFIIFISIPSILNAQMNSESILYSKHNLSVTGPGEIKSNSETRVCIFCHVSHNSSPEGPLWNHETTSSTNYRTYERITLTGKPEQPNGATKLCLSCHDGTIAVGAIRGILKPLTLEGVNHDGTIPASKKSNFGMDLTGTHPVSINFNQTTALATGHLKWPLDNNDKRDFLDANGYVQCTSCHDAHGSASDKYPFWKRKTFSEVCLACHQF